MSTVRKSKTRAVKIIDGISDEVGDYSNDPFIIRKNKQIDDFIKKHPFPIDEYDKYSDSPFIIRKNKEMDEFLRTHPLPKDSEFTSDQDAKV